MREMEEERANMREHVMKEVDTDKEIVQYVLLSVKLKIVKIVYS